MSRICRNNRWPSYLSTYVCSSDLNEQTDPRARTFAIDAAKQMGMVMHERPVRGGTDGARLSEMGVPTPNIFNGGHEYHSVYEWNSVQNLQHSLEYLKSLLKYWATHHEPEIGRAHV